MLSAFDGEKFETMYHAKLILFVI